MYQATGIAFKAKKDSHLWLPPRDSSGQEVPQPITVGAFEADVNISVCARQADWTTAPPSIDWGINVHGGGRIQDYEYLLRVRGPGGEEFVIDPEIHLMKA